MRQAANRQNSGISIHALHEESDIDAHRADAYNRISIHALHEESDLSNHAFLAVSSGFQSTLSMRRATFTMASSITPAV